MPDIGRNAICLCGSGKKYKKCCLAKDEQAAALRRAAKALPPPTPSEPLWTLDDDGLDDLSNSVIDLARDRRFDEALAACRRLLDEFPEVVDGLERSAMVRAAMGEHRLAADLYRQALDFVTHPSRKNDYEGSDYYREQIEIEERLAGLR